MNDKAKKKVKKGKHHHSLTSLHMRRMREIIVHADSLFPFLAYPLIQTMDMYSHPSS